MGLDSFSEEMAYYITEICEAYKDAGEKPDRVVFVNPCKEGLQIVIMSRDRAKSFFSNVSDQMSATLREELPVLWERLKTPLRVGYCLIVLDGVLGSGWSDFHYAGFVTQKEELPKYTAPGASGVN